MNKRLIRFAVTLVAAAVVAFVFYSGLTTQSLGQVIASLAVVVGWAFYPHGKVSV